ncbi:MAG: hypothetical protein JWN48_5011 [Myxococcaceae bacterium]|nr:hypothetical protein [Myxococcaceae bacterium]
MGPSMKPSFSTLPAALAVASCLLSLGCGSDDNEPLYSSGVDASKTGTKLSDDDKRQFCRSLDQHVDVVIGFEEVARIACLPTALLFGGSKAGCEQMLDNCAAGAPSPITVSARRSSEEQTCYTNLSMCEASVGTLEACVNVNVSLVRNVLETVTCARYGDTTAADRAARVMNTAGSCAGQSSSCNAAATTLLL